MSINRKFTTICFAAVLALGLSACGSGSDDDTAMMCPEGQVGTYPDCSDPVVPPTPYEMAVANIAAATTAAAAQAAYDAALGDVTGTQAAQLKTALDMRIAALATAGRAGEQRMALMTAAGMVDTSDLSNADAIAAASAAIAALKAAIAAAVDVDDTSMYQGMVDTAETAVATAQGVLDHAAQTAALASAVEALQAIDLSDLSTQAMIDAAEAAIAALRTALDGATELSAAEKTVAMTELATASRNVMAAQGSVDIAGQMTMLADAVAALEAIDLGALMTQDDIDAAEAAIIALDLALQAASSLTDAQKLDATVDVTVAKRRVASAQTALDENVGNQRVAVAEAAEALGEIDLDDLDTQAKIDAADAAVDALKAALDGATHLSDADKAAAQAQLDTATETVRMADTDTGTKVVNEARVYNNRGAPKRVTFAAGGHTVEATGDNVGYLTTLVVANVMGTAFETDGTQTHVPKPRETNVYLRGTYDGAPGEYRCSGDVACTVDNDGKGSPSALGGTWHFKPDAGAMVSTPDAEYLYYGWWVSKDKDGGPTAASAFVGVVEPTAGALDTGGNLTALTGSATYVGNAAGKYAIDNVLAGTGHGGHFTADAELSATFGTGTTAGVTGTIDNFRLNDGTEDPGWSVSLARAALGGADGAITPEAADLTNTTADGTTWSINGNAAPESGTWSGTMYDELPGNTDGTPPGDGSNIPTTVTGTWYSEFSTMGRMVGAFGANKQ